MRTPAPSSTAHTELFTRNQIPLQTDLGHGTQDMRHRTQDTGHASQSMKTLIDFYLQGEVGMLGLHGAPD